MKKIIIFLILVVFFVTLVPVSFASDTIIDNFDPGYVETVSGFSAGSNGIGGSHRVGNGAVTYTPTLVDGLYNVSYYIPYVGSNNGFGIYAEIYHAKGMTKVDIDMRKAEKVGWVKLGEFQFKSGMPAYVKLNCESGSWLRADAVEFSFIGEIGANDKIEDVTGNDYQNSIEKIVKLGFMDAQENKFDPDGFVTRADIAKIAYLLLGLDKEVEPKNTLTPFYDVNPESKEAYFINKVAEFGILSGFPDKTFRPNTRLTFNEAVKILVTILGYDKVAEAKGGYPYGYLAVASNEKILTSSVGGTDALNRATLAYLIDRSLNANVLELSSIGESSGYKKGETLLSKNSNIVLKKGIVTKNEFTSITDSSKLQKNEVMIGEEIFTDTTKSNCLGYYVEAYVFIDDDKNEKKIIYMDISSKNNTLEISADDIASTTLTSIEYTDSNDKEIKVKLNTAFDMIYNGKAKRDYNATDLNPNFGKLVLIDNDSDNVYDIVFVWDLTYKMVDGVNTTTNVVRFTDNTNIDLDEKTGIFSLMVIQNGKIANIQNVKKGSVLGYCENADVKTLYVSNETVDGVIDEATNEDLTIAGKSYEYSKYMSITNAQSGKKATIHLDDQKKIGFITLMDINTNEEYAYVISVDAKIKISDTVDVKLFEQNGTVKIYTLDNISLDGRKASNIDMINSIVAGNVIKVFKNEKGEILSVDTPIDKTADANYQGYSEGEFCKDYKSASIRYIGMSQKAFASKFMMTDNTLIFNIPATDDPKDKDYRMIKTNNLTHYLKPYSISLFSTDSNMEVGVCVVKDDPTYVEELEKENIAFVVEKVTSAIDEYGETRQKLYGYYDGKKTEMFIKDMKIQKKNVFAFYDKVKYPSLQTGDFNLVTDIRPGDVFQFTKDVFGELNNIVMLFRVNDINDPLYSEKDFVEGGKAATSKYNNYQILYTGYGTVSRIYDRRFTLLTNNTDNWLRNIPVSDAKIFKYSNGKVIPTSSAYISQNARIFVHNRYADTMIIFIIEN